MNPGPQPRSSLILALLLIGVAVSTLLYYRTLPVEAERERPTLGVDFFMENAELKGMGPNGRILYRVNADRAAQAAENTTVNMTDVHFSYDPVTEIPWDLVADTGRIPPGGNIIELEGRVLAIAQEGDRPATTIRTEYLEIEPAIMVARTGRKVVIEVDGRRINAIGLNADLEKNELKLLSNVNGKFYP